MYIFNVLLPHKYPCHLLATRSLLSIKLFCLVYIANVVLWQTEQFPCHVERQKKCLFLLRLCIEIGGVGIWILTSCQPHRVTSGQLGQEGHLRTTRPRSGDQKQAYFYTLSPLSIILHTAGLCCTCEHCIILSELLFLASSTKCTPNQRNCVYISVYVNMPNCMHI